MEKVSNLGYTKEALKQELRKAMLYYLAQYGYNWTVDALQEVLDECLIERKRQHESRD